MVQTSVSGKIKIVY